jgi:hypothetical protein
MIFYLILILLLKKIINILFKVENAHTLFRSFFCFFISTLSLFFSIINWEYLITNPLDSTNLSLFINKLMLSYMIIDTSYFLYIKNYRIELMLHHVICIILYGLFYDKAILSFCACNEILSAFNWIGIIYPSYEWSVKLFRLYSIIFIRFFIWIFTLYFLSKYNKLYYIALFVITIFICLDCYWSWIIIFNYYKYKNFIKKKIISGTNKIVNKTLKYK